MRLLTGSALLAALLIAGCTTMTPEERRAMDSQTCASYGFKRGGDGFASCLLNLELDRREESRAQFENMRYNNPPIILYDGKYRRW